MNAALWIALILLVLLAAVAAQVVVLRRRRAKRRLKPVPALRYPVVLAHGIMGFDEIALLGARQEYFRGIARSLRGCGAEVYRTRVPPVAPIPVRAERLAAFLRELPCKRVNIIAHSMGGLDARYAISRLGMGDRIASVTTIGTPHFGTPIADVRDGLVTGILHKMLGAVGVDADALRSLGTRRMAEFNQEVLDDRRVHYGSIVAVAPEGNGINPILLPAYHWLKRRVGPNDGLVPGDSQRWGEVLQEIEADHWAQIGWSLSGFDATAFYAELIRELRSRGL